MATTVASAAAPRRVVIVGGVAGGMSCAARLRRLDESAQIVVLDRGEHVSFANCGLPYFVAGEIETADRLLVQTPQTLQAALNLDVRIRHEVIAINTDQHTVTVLTPDGPGTLPYDSLVLAPGATAVRPPLPGLDSARVLTLRTVGDATTLRDRVDQGARHAVVLGAGFIGLEAAEALRRQGLGVHVVELASHVLPPLEPEMASLVRSELVRLGITVRDGVGAAEVEHLDDSDVVVLTDGTRLPADVVVLSVGVRPATAPFEAAGIACDRGAIVVDAHGRTSAPDVWAVGDATVSADAVTGVRRPVALAGPANRAGRLVADAIVNPASAQPIPSAVGTSILRVGGLAAAMTGANRASLDAAGIDHHTIHLHPNHHAGYFPGATPVHLVMHLRTGDGLILGAQAVGTEGVDKRIDVLAVAIRNKMHATELIDLDLAYSPPYGSAKDPVNLAGMLADNVLSGLIRLWYADAVEAAIDDTLLLDVRSVDEFATGHLPGAVNIAHTELRGRLDEVAAAAAGRPVRVMCATGWRSYLAYRVLDAAGFDAATLSGGLTTLRATLGADAESLFVAEVPV